MTTVTLFPEKPWSPPRKYGRKIPAKGKWRTPHYGYDHYVCPSLLLKAFIEEHSHEFQSKLMSNRFDTKTPFIADDIGWREVLAREIADIQRVSMDVALRRLWGVMGGEWKVINANFADATVLACGLDLDRDTNIPTLPGNKKDALDLVQIRAEIKGINLPEMKAHRMARQVMKLSNLIVHYPHNTERLVPLAPLNCLSPIQ